jgi:LruC domain-containing protein
MSRSSLWVLPLAVLLVSACSIGGQNGSATIPADIVNDQLRSAAAEFAFQAIAPVELQLDVNLYDVSGSASSVASYASAVNGDWPVYVSLVDPNGQVLYGGVFSSEGSLDTTLLVDGAMEEVTMKIDAEGYEERTFAIDDPAQYATIDRTISLTTTDETTATDTDGDGVPDAYDLFPTDPDSAFALNVPVDGFPMTVAFEDNYPELGDGDFNDFLGQYKVVEMYAPYGKPGTAEVLTVIHVEAWAVGHIAGYDHRFGVTIDIGSKTATLSVWRYDAGGEEIDPQPPSQVTGRVDVMLFEHTSQAAAPNEASQTDYAGYYTVFELRFPTSIPDLNDPRWGVELPPYDPYLYIHDTEQDVHLIGKPALPDSQNLIVFDDFRDAAGFPRGLLMPYNWACPTEGTHIEDAYELFYDWRTDGGLSNQDWYRQPSDPMLVEQMAFPFPYEP